MESQDLHCKSNTSCCQYDPEQPAKRSTAPGSVMGLRSASALRQRRELHPHLRTQLPPFFRSQLIQFLRDFIHNALTFLFTLRSAIFHQRIVPQRLHFPGPHFKHALAHRSLSGTGKIFFVGPLMSLPNIVVLHLAAETAGGSDLPTVFPSCPGAGSPQ